MYSVVQKDYWQKIKRDFIAGFEHNEQIMKAGSANSSDVIDCVKNLGYEMVRKDGDDMDWRGRRLGQQRPCCPFHLAS